MHEPSYFTLFILGLFGGAFIVITIISASSHHENSYFIPPCDTNHQGHWEVSVMDAGDKEIVEPIINKYIVLGWHNIRAEIHNEGVNDRILADC